MQSFSQTLIFSSQVQEEEEEFEDRVVMTDRGGNTKVRLVEKVVGDKKEVLM